MTKALLFNSSDVPPEVARLLNPAYCGGLISRAAIRYAAAQVEREPTEPTGLPYIIAFLVLPLVLHAPTRDRITSHKATYGLHRFVREHPELIPGLDRRVQAFEVHTRSALIFGASHHVLQVDPETLRVSGDDQFAARLTGSEGLPKTASKSVYAADRLGAWLAGVDPAQAFMMLQLTL